MTTTIPFIAYEISGLAFPTSTGYYNSGAVNYKFVNAISGGLKSQITQAAQGGTMSSAFQTLTASTGLSPFTSTVKVSGSQAQTLSVLGYSTISSNAKGVSSVLTSGVKYTLAYNWFVESSNKLSTHENDTTVLHTTVAEKAKWNDISASGVKYTKAYLSGSTGVFQAHSTVLDSVAGSTYAGDDAITTVGTIGTGTWNATAILYPKLDTVSLPKISANALKGGTIAASGVKYTLAYNWFTQSSNKLSTHENDTTLHTTAAQTAKLDSISTSGVKYTSAYRSAQATKVHAFHAKISSSYLAANYGWANITSGSKRIAHSLAGTPNFINITPSGMITFAYAVYNPNSVDFTVAITAAGSRDIKWNAHI